MIYGVYIPDTKKYKKAFYDGFIKKQKTKIFFLLKILIAIVLYAYLLKKFNLLSTFALLSQVNVTYLLISIILAFCLILQLNFKWVQILSVLGVKIKSKKTVGVTFVSVFMNLITPSKLGDLIKVHYIKKQLKRSYQTALTSFVIERYLEIVILVLFPLFGFIYSVGSTTALFFDFILLIFLLILFTKINLIMSLFKKVLQKTFKSKSIDISPFNYKLFDFWKPMIHTFIYWIITFIQIYFLFLAVNVEIEIIKVIILSPLCILVSLLPITIGGMGTRESAFVFFFHNCVNPSQALLVGFLMTITKILLPGLIGAVYLIKYPVSTSNKAL